MPGIVTLSGTLHSPSRTDRLLDALVAAIVARTGSDSHGIHLLDQGHALIDALTPAAPSAPSSGALTEAYQQVADADLLVVASPVYKGSYTGLLKLFLDPIPQDQLAGRPVLIAATGGNQLHSLVLDHQLRPLFAFFRANVLPIGVYAHNAEFLADGGFAPELTATIELAADAAAAVLPRVT